MKITFRCDPALADLLPRPVAAQDVLPNWLREMAPREHSPVHQRSIRTAKQCPPFIDAMRHGFTILLPCDVMVQDGRFSWDWALPPLTAHFHPRAPLNFHVPEQLLGTPLSHGTRSAIKFNSFWTIETEPGWSLMAVHPINRDDLPFRLVSGLVDTDRFNAVGINFPAVWIDDAFNGRLPRGTPVAQCFPVRREAPTLVCETMSDQRLQDHDALATQIMAGPGVYRRAYRRKNSAT